MPPLLKLFRRAIVAELDAIASGKLDAEPERVLDLLDAADEVDEAIARWTEAST
jgi:hypothetical protein